MNIVHTELSLQEIMSKSQKNAQSSNVSAKGRKRKIVPSSTENVTNVTKKSRLTTTQ